MAGVRDHTELDVWKLCDDLRCRIRDIVDRPGFSRYAKLREQLEEAAESPCPNIGEGFSRYFPRDNARFVRVAAGSLTEVIEHLGRAAARRLITPPEGQELRSLARRARGAATRYIVYLESATAPNVPRTKPRGRKRKGKK
jgi:four helix bundle protein